MKKFQVVNREYVPTVDLNVLNQTFSNRETAHNEAIKASSELKNAIASLDLNDQEDGFKSQLLFDIENTLNNNSTLGDYAASYDDMLKLSGDMISSPALIGRLKAQQEYKTFIDTINSSEMPDNYKEYFKENNPYYYNDKYDEKGNIIGGSKWEAIKNPTKIFSLTDVIDKALKRVAAEKGSSEIPQYIDAYGNVVTDPKDATGMQLYNVITNTYERLTKEKIIKSIKAVIDENPAIKESFKQDYEIALWEYENGKSQDVINPNGSIMSEDNYLLKKIDPAAQLAAYNYVQSESSYGKGLSKHKSGTRLENMGALNTLIDSNISTQSRGIPFKVTTSREKIQETKNILFNGIQKQLLALGISNNIVNNILKNNYGSISTLVNSLEITKDNQKDFLKLHQLFKQYESNHLMEQNMISNSVYDYKDYVRLRDMGDIKENWAGQIGIIPDRIKANLDNSPELVKELNEDRENLYNIYKALVTGSELPNNRYGNTIKMYYNHMFNNGKLYIKPDENMIPYYVNLLKPYYNTDKGLYVINSDDNMYENIELINLLRGQPQVLKFVDENGKSDNKRLAFNRHNLNRAINTYIKFGSEEAKITDSSLILSSNILQGQSFTQNYLLDLYNNGMLERADYAKLSDEYNDFILNQIKTANFADYSVYESIDGSTATLLPQQNRISASNKIIDKIKNKEAAIAPAFVSQIKDPITQSLGGYYVSFTDTEKLKDGDGEYIRDENDEIKTATHRYVYYIPGIGGENVNDILFSDPDVQITNSLDVLEASNGDLKVTNKYNTPKIGDSTLSVENFGNYKYNIFNKDYNITKDVALPLIKNANLIEELKLLLSAQENKTDYFKTMLNNNPNLAQALDEYIRILSNITDIEQNDITDIIIQELTN